MASLTALGLMSGTSMDGVDVAVVRTDGTRIHALGPSSYRAYRACERQLLGAAVAASTELFSRAARPGILAEAEALLTAIHAEAVEACLCAYPCLYGQIDVVGFHGQTVLHRPQAGLTVQIGDGKALAARLGLPVVYDFRAADLAAGGEGAPLVPVYHQALLEGRRMPRPLAVLNIGGVANVTFLDAQARLIAFDTGPGNALLDDFMQARTGAPHDRDGAAAAAGRVDERVLNTVLGDPYFRRPPPKSLDRNAFAGLNLDRLGLADGAATLTALTVESVARACTLLPGAPRLWIVAGGGSRNPTLMQRLGDRLAPAPVLRAEELGWRADALEAQAFAYLAVRTLLRAPISFPDTTGVGRPTCGGTVVYP